MMKVKNTDYINKYQVELKVAIHYGSTTYLYFLDDVTQRANDVPYGLCASVWSENAGRIHRVASKLKVRH